jgi:hypothetical protein
METGLKVVDKMEADGCMKFDLLSQTQKMLRKALETLMNYSSSDFRMNKIHSRTMMLTNLGRACLMEDAR